MTGYKNATPAFADSPSVIVL